MKQIGLSIKRSVLFSLLLIVFLCMGCEYKFIDYDLPDTGEAISFSEQIVPIFNSENNCNSCHTSGSQYVDLTPDYAYQNIVPSLVDMESPELSKIYDVPRPGSQGHAFSKYDTAQAFLVLEWIKQGALNN